MSKMLDVDGKKSRKLTVLYVVALRKFLGQRDKLNRKIEQTAELITAHANSLPEDERAAQLQKLTELVSGPPGFTESVRRVLRNVPSHELTPKKLRDLLRTAGFDLSAYTNPLASIHTILKRLVERGEVEVFENDGETKYRWKQE